MVDGQNESLLLNVKTDGHILRQRRLKRSLQQVNKANQTKAELTAVE